MGNSLRRSFDRQRVPRARASTAERPIARQAVVPPGPEQTLLYLQRMVGNQAVGQFLHALADDPSGDGTQPTSSRVGGGSPSMTGIVVQRCGDKPCNCSPEEEAAHMAPASVRPVARADEEVAAQRALVAQREPTPAEFAIRGKFPGASGEPHLLFFDMGSARLDAEERGKFAALATPPAKSLTLKGTASEEGQAVDNLSLVNRRIATVDAALREQGHTGTRTLDPEPDAGKGNIDYRHARSVEVRESGTPSATLDCSAGPQPNNCGPAPNAFTTAQKRAVEMVNKAIAAVSTPTPDPATASLLTQLFGGPGTAPTVSANLLLIQGQLGNMLPDSGHRCVNACDALCGGSAIAYNTDTGASAMMTLCPIFMSEPDLDKRAETLIHEGSHGTAGLETGDQAYTWQRLITKLGAAGLHNADSYASFVGLINDPGSITLGPDTPDAHTGGMSDPQKEAADTAVAWLEQWLIGSQSEMSSLYGTINESISGGSWTNDYYKDTMAFVAPAFGLTPPPAVPVARDQVAVAGIADRVQQLVDAVSGGPLNLHKAGGGVTSWSVAAKTVRLAPAFFTLDARGQVDLLLRSLCQALPTVGPAQASRYVDVIHHVVTHNSLGSP